MKRIIGFLGKRSCRAGRANFTARLPLHWLPAIALLAFVAQSALAQAGFQTTVPTDILTQFRNQRILWTTNVWVYANRLFGILALIEFTWSAVTMVLDKTDLQSWTSALIRKIMWIGAFYALLFNGRNWIPAIIDSFEQIGSNAAAMSGPLSPSDVMAQGINIAGALMDSAGSSGFFTNPGPVFALVFCAILIVLSYVIITINFVVVMVESYIIVSVGFVFLGFGGSRWTAPYLERYIGLAVSIGIKIVLIYCLISAGFNLGRRLGNRGSHGGHFSASCVDRVRCYGWRCHFHDALLADSEAVRCGTRRCSSIDGRRPGHNGHRVGRRRIRSQVTRCRSRRIARRCLDGRHSRWNNVRRESWRRRCRGGQNNCRGQFSSFGRRPRGFRAATRIIRPERKRHESENTVTPTRRPWQQRRGSRRQQRFADRYREFSAASYKPEWLVKSFNNTSIRPCRFRRRAS
ncbi:MAG TPA: P-type conjugative transfer protein TrbL [Bryobacteraceae bacterium]|nr:P-type conjugative transfer protein TrbL [Bryobacteraceae bacterium]